MLQRKLICYFSGLYMMQVIDFMNFVGKGVTYAQNSRPIQPINDRKFKFEM